MLEELSGLQEDDEQYWMTSMSFTVETRSEDGRELVQKEYTFTWGEEFDEWRFSEYKEKRTTDTTRISDRNWETSRHVWWDERGGEPIDVEIPQTVSDKLAERLGTDNVEIQL